MIGNCYASVTVNDNRNMSSATLIELGNNSDAVSDMKGLQRGAPKAAQEKALIPLDTMGNERAV